MTNQNCWSFKIDSSMQNDLKGFIPEKAYDQVVNLLNHDHLVVKIKKERKTRHGDYKQLPNG